MSDLYLAMDPRAWLADELVARGLSQKTFAAQIGVSPPQLNNHLSRRRRLNASKEEAVIRALDLSEALARQYRALVALDRAPSSREWDLAQVLAGQRQAHGQHVVLRDLPGPLDLEAAALRELTQLPGHRPDPELLASTLDPPHLPREVDPWLAQAATLPPRTPPGRAQPGPPLHTRSEGPAPPEVAALHQAARRAALAAFDRVGHADRHYGMLFQAIPASSLPAVQDELRQLCARVQARCEAALAEQRPTRRVYALLLHLTPLTRSLGADPPARPQPPAWVEAEAPPPWRAGDPEPSLYSSLDYRNFLSDWRSHRGLTLEQVGMKVRRGLPEGAELTRQQIHAILHRTAHLQPEHVSAWAAALELGVGDARYLSAVLAWHLAEDPLERARCWAELLPYHQMGLGWRLSRSSEVLLRSWLAPALIELARHPAFVPDPAWIQGALAVPASEAEITATLTLLQELRYLSWTPAGHLVPAVGTVHTDDAALTRDATRTLFQEVSALCAAPPDPAATVDLLVQAAPDAVLSALRADLEETRLRIQGLMDAALEGRSDLPSGGAPAAPDRVWMLALQHFPLTRPRPRRL